MPKHTPDLGVPRRMQRQAWGRVLRCSQRVRVLGAGVQEQRCSFRDANACGSVRWVTPPGEACLRRRTRAREALGVQSDRAVPAPKGVTLSESFYLREFRKVTCTHPRRAGWGTGQGQGEGQSGGRCSRSPSAQKDPLCTRQVGRQSPSVPARMVITEHRERNLPKCGS